MPIDPRLLVISQWLSPAYPLGSFAYSHGLESAVSSGWVTDPASLQSWLGDVLAQGTGRMDAGWITLAHDAEPEALDDLNAEARAYAPARERLWESERQGQAFVRITAEVWQIDLPDLLLPLALGRAARCLDLPLDEVITLYLQSFTSNLVNVAQRLMPIGQTEAQRVLCALAPLCVEVARTGRVSGPEDLCSNAFLSDIAAMRHETLEPRLFQS